MDSPPTSELAFLTQEGEALPQPQEWVPGWVEIPAPVSAYSHVCVLRNGQEVTAVVRRLAGRARVLVEWPLSGPGHYRLRAQLPESVAERVFTVQPSKISSAALEQLLADLQESLPASIALGLRRCGGLAGLQILPPGDNTLRQEVERLRRAILGSSKRQGLATILPRLQQDPHRMLHPESLWVPVERARRVHPVGLLESLRRSDNLDGEKRPVRVLDSRVEHSLDVYENRLVKAFVHQVSLRLRWLMRYLAGDNALCADVAHLVSMFRKAQQSAPFLHEVQVPANLVPRVTMVLLKVPPYRAALEHFVEFNRVLRVRLDDARLEAPLNNLPALYELWGTLQCHAAVLNVAAALDFRIGHNQLVDRDKSGLFVRPLPIGAATLELSRDDVTVRVIPQRNYSHDGNPIHSVTYTQIPDLVVEISRPGSRPCVLVFDPKYKMDKDGPVKADIDKMHTYRDAIRDGCGRVVALAAILYPGENRQFNCDDVLALQAHPGRGDLRSAIGSLVRKHVEHCMGATPREHPRQLQEQRGQEEWGA